MLVRKHPDAGNCGFRLEAFGDAATDEAVARGKAGEPAFYAHEGGPTVGTKPIDDFDPWRVDGSLMRTATTAKVATAHASGRSCGAASDDDRKAAVDSHCIVFTSLDG